MTFEKADYYRYRRIIRLIKSLEDEEEKNRRLDELRSNIEKMRKEALKEEKRQGNWQGPIL